MPMTPFMKRFPELGARETRSVTVPDKEDVPSGEYGFIELYCNEPNCDCRRVVVVVLRPETGWQFWAVINYGWESVKFYRLQKTSRCPEKGLQRITCSAITTTHRRNGACRTAPCTGRP